ncbi:MULTISPECIES: DUF4397 domain-containing protein [unclassified Shewanella]|uniref:DUF4397 domain-containing protein n=1 Tax=unclassified Shewanella TaxID=196818 RepID=UPI001BBD40DE|nr:MULTISPECIES: DUF4397 domain-containing protein [unclassified Shewanella]GIU19368.1 hypothetical protein TUM4444_35610 [Shewanella sp. MBTL60-112-B1]GIU24945.1 hypothetical protein TUM4445_02540 [Shewanella sp. MBTL60-112-B2]
MKLTTWRNISLSVLMSTLVACSSDDNGSTSDSSYIQYYNASPNSTSTVLVLDDYGYSEVSFSDALPRYEYGTGLSELEITGLDASGEELTLYQASVELANTDNHLFMLVGDYSEPELLDIVYRRSEMDELNSDESGDYSKMQVLVAHAAMGESSFDVYFGKPAEGFSSATMLASLSYKSYSNEQMFDTGEYVLYLTESGKTAPIFTTATLELTANTVYKLIVRNSFGPGVPKLTVDNVDSTGSPEQYSNIDANAEYRLFNGLTNTDMINAELVSHQESQYLYELSQNQLTEFKAIGYNDYGVSISDSATSDVLANNLLVTFNQDESKSIVLYEDELGETKGMTITHDHRPRAFEHQINLANLVADFDELTIYFVRSSETIESAEYKLSGLAFTELGNISLPSDDYEISVVFKDDNDTLTLVYQSDVVPFSQAGNYTMVLNSDDSQPLGYRLTTFQ